MQDKTIFVKNIELENFSCFEHLKVDKFANINLIVGDNDSGKTKLLDAIYLFFDHRKIFNLPYLMQEKYDRVYERFFYKKNNVTALQSKISIDNQFLNIQDNTRDIEDTDIEPKDIERAAEFLQKNDIKMIDIKFSKNDIPLFDIILSPRSLWTGFRPRLILKRNNRDINTKNVYYKKSSQHNSGFASYFSKMDGDKDNLLYKEIISLISAEFPEVDTDVERPLALIDEKIAIRNTTSLNISSMGTGFQHLLHIICEYVIGGGADIILLDEPELGLHFNKYPALIDLLIKLAQNGKQIFFTTHSSQLGICFVEKILAQSLQNSAKIYKLKYNNEHHRTIEKQTISNETFASEDTCIREITECKIEEANEKIFGNWVSK